MELINFLQNALERENSLFRAQLLREDIERLQRLQALASKAASRETFVKEGFFVGWTQNDMRTYEFKEELEEFLCAFYDDFSAAAPSKESASRLETTWNRLHAKRLERLVGCLSRVPKPGDVRE